MIMTSRTACKILVLVCWMQLLLTAAATEEILLQVVENSPAGFVVGTVQDESNSNNYQFTSAPCGDYFVIDGESSLITVGDRQLLNREKIVQENGNSDRLSCLISFVTVTNTQHVVDITIEVLDVNDETPFFFNLSQPFIKTISESLTVEAQVVRLRPVDGDKGRNGTVQFQITSGNEEKYFKIGVALGDTPESTTTRYLFLNRSLNFEELTSFNLTITINDMGDTPLSSEQLVLLRVLNIPDEPPMFIVSTYYFEVQENHPVGSQNEFGRVEATSDNPSGIRYQICSDCHQKPANVTSMVGINQSTGGLYLKHVIDYETITPTTFRFTVQAVSLNSGLDGSSSVELEILNINEEPPFFTCLFMSDLVTSFNCNRDRSVNNSYLYIRENLNLSSTLLSLLTKDNDQSPPLRIVNGTALELSLEPQTSNFSVLLSPMRSSTTSSFVISFMLSGTLDREDTPNLTLTLTAENVAKPSLRTNSFIYIKVLDSNDNTPEFVAGDEGYISEGSPAGREVLRVEAQDPDEGRNGLLNYYISKVDKEVAANWFQISPEDGMISVSEGATIDYHTVGGSVRLNVEISDNGSQPLTLSVTVLIIVLPSSTFVSYAYQEYSRSDFNLLANTTTDFYMEFRTTERDGLLVYQQDSGGYAFSVQLRDGNVIARLGTLEEVEPYASNDEWHSIYIQRFQNQLVLAVFLADNSTLLQESINTKRCVNRSEEELLNIDHQSSLYIGGINVFLLHPNHSVGTPNFLGVVRNVLVGGVQLNSNCPVTEINTIRGVVRSHGCSQMTCNSSHTTQCVDYAEESYCQCLGGFTSSVCMAAGDGQKDSSYFPIRFKGNTNVNLNLGYSFFYELEVRRNGSPLEPGSSDLTPGAGTGVGTGSGGSPEKRRKRDIISRKRRDSSGPNTRENIVQEIEVQFRIVELRNAVLLYSQTPSSVHLLQIIDYGDGNASLMYRVFNEERNNLYIILSTMKSSLRRQTQYSVRITIAMDYVSLNFLEESCTASWEYSFITPFAEQPQTSISIGGAFDSILSPSNENLGYFSGCISRVSIDSIELPLNGLLSAPSEDGGFQVEDRESVENTCDLCDLTTCPVMNSTCLADVSGSTECVCSGGLVFADSGLSCVPPSASTPVGITPSKQSLPLTYIGLGSGAAVLVILGVIVILIIVFVRKREEKKKRTCSITPMTTRQFRSKSSNQYTPTMVAKQCKSSMASSMNVPSTDSHERESSVSTFQEHGGDVDSDSPVRHTISGARHKSRTSIESGINTDMDQEASIRTGHGIPRMEDSGHEVNSTDSVPGSESDDIASSCYNHQPHPVLKIMGGISSPDHSHSSHTPRTPRTPLTPKEKKVMIPLRPASTNLSQSDYGDEATDIEMESLHTRSSEMGSSMQNQGRGSDSENSKISGCSTPQWYKSSTTSDTEREIERIESTHPYYPKHPESMRRNYQLHFKEGDPHPPMYHSPPTFSEHSNYPRGGGGGAGKARSLHNSPLTKTLHQRYENYPHPFTTERLRNGRLSYEHHRPDPNYDGNSSSRHGKHHGDPRVLLSESEYTSMSFTRQYSDQRIPQNGNYCIPRKHTDTLPAHNRQMSDPRETTQQTQDSMLSSQSIRHVRSPNGYSSRRHNAIQDDQKQFYTLGRVIPEHIHYSPTNQPSRSFSSRDAAQNEEPSFQTLKSLSKIDPITSWDAQDRMKIAVDHMDPYHLLSGPYVQFEDVSTDPSVIESQLTMDESVLGEQVFDSQGGGEGSAVMLDPLDARLARLREDEIDSILTDSEMGRQIMNHFPSADCSSQYTATIVAGSTSTSGESTPKLQKVFVVPSSQQSFDV